MGSRQPRSSFLLFIGIALGWMLGAVPGAAAAAGALFLAPSPYLSFADSPFADTNQFAYFHLETFESGAFAAPGATPSPNWTVTSPGPYTDSVDADDGVIDGSGTNARSFYSNLVATNLTITFSAGLLGGHLPTHVGIVCTDIGKALFGSDGFGDVVFSARDGNGVFLGAITNLNFGNGSSLGSGPGATAEDRFFGVIDTGGISSISIGVDNSVDWEVDHLQYGYAAPPLRIQWMPPAGVLIAWPTNASGLALQQNTNLASANWITLTNMPAVVGTENQVTLGALPGKAFYRLIVP